MTGSRRLLLLPVLLLVQLVLVGLAVGPQLSARTLGDEITLRVRPLDPVDPFRGAYVALAYPDLRHPGSRGMGGLGRMTDDDAGAVYLSLREEGEVWVAVDWTRERPTTGTYLRCADRDWTISCGIESWFLPQRDARELEESVADGTVVATVKVDGRGNAALVALDVN